MLIVERWLLGRLCNRRLNGHAEVNQAIRDDFIGIGIATLGA